MNHVKLPFRFDPCLLERDLAAIRADEWVAHFNTGDYDGAWSGVALRGVGGDARSIYPDPSGQYSDTPVLDRTPYVRSVLAAFECPLMCVRLLRLGARSHIREHRDLRLSHADGEVRIHVPVVTNDDVVFVLDGERVPMSAGDAWYLDLGLPHRVENASDTDRVHLVVDCMVNDWLDELLREPAVEVAEPPVVGTARPVRRRTSAEETFDDPLTATIVTFLRQIGLPVAKAEVDDDTVVPGVRIEDGVLVVDEARLRYPGDLLHEAGHLAVVEPTRREAMGANAESDPGEEMAAIAWSYAAAVEIGIDPGVVFHADGYRGGSSALLENFAAGRYVGVPLLQWFGMTVDAEQASRHGCSPYPAMRRWVRTGELPGSSTPLLSSGQGREGRT